MNLDLTQADSGSSKRKTIKQKLVAFWSIKRNRIITIVLFVIVVLSLLALGFYFLVYKDDGEVEKTVENSEQAPQLYKSILDGTMVSLEDANRHPLGIMVENHVDARPQSGLSQASIVYEAIAEGGITRFLAVFGPKGAAKVGPVRSARTYYVDWIREINGYYSHVGGNYDALQLIKSAGILDLDQFANPSAYWRDKSRKVSSEHTMYTDTSRLYKIASDKKYSTDNNFIAYSYKEEPEVSTIVPTIQTISINFGNTNYNVVYRYNKETNSYQRELAGKPHLDAENNAQISAKNVIIQTVTRKAVVTAINESGYSMDTVGSGTAQIFNDGAKIEATWKKENTNSRTRFFDKSTGAEIQFNPGQTWIEIVSPDLSFSAI